MSGIQLLDKTRKIGKLLHNSHSSKVVFNDICKVMQDALQSNVLVISRKGKVLGISGKDGGAIRELSGCNVGSFLDPLLNERMLSILSTKENASLATLGFDGEEDEEFSAIVTPIEIAGERLGTLRAVTEESAEEDRKIAVVHAALGTLSYSELEAISLIFQELHGTEGILVASKIADQAGITRSVIVNALRKFESAGIIESRSSGMKGTYIKVCNEFAYGEIRKMKEKK